MIAVLKAKFDDEAQRFDDLTEEVVGSVSIETEQAVMNEVQKMQRLFNQVDRDGSGFIDHNEFAYVIDMLGSVMSAKDVEDTFARLDADGSGVVGGCCPLARACSVLLQIVLHF